MKVLTLTHDALPSHFTNTEQTVCTFNELARLGHEVEIVCRGARGRGEALRSEVAQYYGLKELAETLTLSPLGGSGESGTRREAQADLRNVLHARRAATPVLVHTRDLFALTLALLLGLPSVFETYRIDLNRDPRFAPWRNWSYRRRNLRGIVTHSELSRRSFLEAGAPAERVVTIYNGYTRAGFEPALTREIARAQLDLPIAQALVVYTGHVEASKGLELFVQLAREIPQATFLAVGALPGSAGERFVGQMIERLGVTNLRLLPRVAPAAVPAYLFAADCLVIPPAGAPLLLHGRTVLPMKTFSYLAAGRPIVAGDLPDLREILHHEKNALLVPPDDAKAAAAGVRRILSDRALAQRLGAQAREDAARYTWSARAARLAGFLEKVHSADAP